MCAGKAFRSGALLLLTGLAGACVPPSASPPRVHKAVPPARVPPSPPVPKARQPVEGTKFLLSGDARQGGVMRGTVPRGARLLRFDGVDIPFDREGNFLIAFDRDADGSAILQAEMRSGRVIERRLTVAPGNWRIERVNASMRAGVPSEEFQQRRAIELEQIHAARAVHAESDGWRQDFRWPITGRISGQFGSQRIYRGTPGSYHSGVDIAAAAGRSFAAPADGVVILAADQPFTLEGHLLMIDHGMGLNSAFLHCSSLFVKVGDVVRQGQVLGTVGSTGRATGPHLHWGMKWNDARLDPVNFAGAMPDD